MATCTPQSLQRNCLGQCGQVGKAMQRPNLTPPQPLKPTKVSRFLPQTSSEGLTTLTKLAEADLQVVLDKTYTLSNVREAYREARLGKTIGKSVIVPD
ncbi:zinc-binding dehydrogenase [Spirosoma sordidisoli]|uniref:Uncharacterized protein n=1 Tax=Spirosoma sordidisoli TaxID=2502893 RepID=A0A4Q2US14_9BACT|nr:zinc-binding dehydrogenase [Spirosoma sordidisoli]RYC70480.1 hypothetical protein EQG79_11555 [Spirosoma sordidisoli]